MIFAVWICEIDVNVFIESLYFRFNNNSAANQNTETFTVGSRLMDVDVNFLF